MAKNIMLVESDQAWQAMLKRDLESAGQKVHVFSHLEAAKAAFQPGLYDWVITDSLFLMVDDGRAWAEALHIGGQKAILLINRSMRTPVPTVDKGSYLHNSLTKLVR
jgi:DNA-binding response OmpR family regulator